MLILFKKKRVQHFQVVTMWFLLSGKRGYFYNGSDVDKDKRCSKYRLDINLTVKAPVKIYFRILLGILMHFLDK